MQITEPGIYHDFPVDAYHADPCPSPSLNQTLAKIILEQSPAHAKCAHLRLGCRADRSEDYVADRTVGSAIHALLLGRGKNLAVAHFDDWRKGEARDFKADAYERGDEPILKKHYDQAAQVAHSIACQMESMHGRKPFTEGVAEVVIAWKEGDYWFRSMMDYDYQHRILEDLKTTGMSVSPAAASFQMADAGWAVQAAFQERGLNILDPENIGRRRFRFIAVENKEPFAITINELSEAVLTIGRQQVDMAIRRWKACMKSGVWPCYSTDTNYPAYPGYKQAAWEERYRELREEYDAAGI